jgi:hypothetical protein
MEIDKWNSGEIESRLQDLFDGIEELNPSTPVQQAYREAAAVLTSFDPNRLQVANDVQAHPQEIHEFFRPFELTSLSTENQWTLTTEVRRENLKHLVAEKRVQQVLAANDRPQNLLQRTFEEVLLGRAKPLLYQNMSELQATLQVSDWLDGIVEVPSIDEIHQRLENESILKPFRDLVGDRFAGREKQLDELSDYVGVYGASGAFESVQRFVETVFSIRKRPPLMVVAPGGMGKSSLIAQFVLTHVAAQYVRRFPFAYLDFDRPGLVPEEPVTLLLEAVRQFAAQFPEARALAKELRTEWQRKSREEGAVDILQVSRTTERLGIAQESMQQRSGEENSMGTTKVVRFREREWFYSRFANFISAIRPNDSPVLLVLDTFEEVQYRGTPFVEGVFDFLEAIQSRIPELRTVLAGRVELKLQNYSVRELKLPPFDRTAAQAFLEKQGLTDVGLGFAIADQIGGSPLTLKLAARLVKAAAEEGGPEGIRNLETGIVAFVKGKSIEAQLYHRILDHIHDPEIKKLAHPGLILRKITAQLIENVLAGPCGVDVSRPGKAEELFDMLAKEIALVENYESGILMHRPDVRALTLRMLIEDKTMVDIAKEINESAIRYYATREGSDARAEELYHLLLFDLDRPRVERRADDPAALAMLIRSIDELPARSQAFLAARTNVERSDRVWQMADLQDWELRTARTTRECLAMHSGKKALSLITERKQRTPDSPLYVLEVDALVEISEMRAAAKRADELLFLPQISPSTRLELELRRARLNAIFKEPLSDEQVRKTLERVSSLVPDLRIVEWLLLVIGAVTEQSTNFLLTEHLRKVQREIPADMWTANEDLRQRVQVSLRLNKPMS